MDKSSQIRGILQQNVRIRGGRPHSRILWIPRWLSKIYSANHNSESTGQPADPDISVKW